jgi:uncharacterized membrane protein (UPF0127 family)
MRIKASEVINKFESLKTHFKQLSNSQGCVYEDDYHNACYNIEDAKVLGEINTWLVACGIPLKKNLVKKMPDKNEESEYKKEVKEKVKHPDVRKMKAEEIYKISSDDEMYGLHTRVRYLDVESDTEFLPEWESKKSDVFEDTEKSKDKKAKTKLSQRIDEEKQKLEEAIRAQNPPEAQSLLQKVRNALDFTELKSIWDQLFKKEEPQELTHQFQEFIDLGGSKFYVTIADTPDKKSAGLEIFDTLEEDKGMLFPFIPPSHVTFHMGKVKFPIDILFLLDDVLGLKVGKVIHNAQPETDELWSNPKTAYVVELKGGMCKKHNIKIGSFCTINKE